ncbi:MAG: hypothetical protein HYR84_09940, partial [Planctomycetes bacterium]|nr:hypothetical protein [Planctomycetota bacterium]
MLSSAVGKLRSTMLSALVGLVLFGFIVPAAVLVTPTAARAQDAEKKDDKKD